jgi:hypothetical protein
MQHPICIRMNDCQICEDGDIVKNINTGKVWTYRGVDTYTHLCGNVESTMKVILASRKGYLGIHTVAYTNENNEVVYPTREELIDAILNEVIEDSLAVNIDIFISQYKIIGKHESDKHEPIDDATYQKILILASINEKKIPQVVGGRSWNKLVEETMNECK